MATVKVPIKNRQEILDRVDMVELLRDIGFQDVDSRAEEQMLFCVFHSDSATPSFSANAAKKVFNCFSSACGVKGDAISLYALWKGLSYEQAAQELLYRPPNRDLERLRSGLRPTAEKMPLRRRLEIVNKFLSAMPLAVRGPAFSYLASRGLSSKIVLDFGISVYDASKASTFDPEQLFAAGLAGISRRCLFEEHPILFPFSLGGQTVFLQGRHLEDRPGPKYLGMRGAIPCLYNHDALFFRPRQVWIAEGVVDVLSLVTLGYGAVVGMVGTYFRPQWETDFSSVEEVYIATDHDAAGDAAFGRIWGYLATPKRRVVRFEFPAQYKDVNAWLVSQIK